MLVVTLSTWVHFLPIVEKIPFNIMTPITSSFSTIFEIAIVTLLNFKRFFYYLIPVKFSIWVKKFQALARQGAGWQGEKKMILKIQENDEDGYESENKINPLLYL